MTFFYQRFLCNTLLLKLMDDDLNVVNATVVYIREMLKQTILSKSRLKGQIIAFLFQVCLIPPLRSSLSIIFYFYHPHFFLGKID